MHCGVCGLPQKYMTLTNDASDTYLCARCNIPYHRCREHPENQVQGQGPEINQKICTCYIRKPIPKLTLVCQRCGTTEEKMRGVYDYTGTKICSSCNLEYHWCPRHPNVQVQDHGPPVNVKVCTCPQRSSNIYQQF